MANAGNPYSDMKFFSVGEKYLKQLASDDWQQLTPITAYIDATNLCTHKCPWCMFKRSEDALALGQIKDVIAQVADLGCKAVVFSGGGEPLLNNKVFPHAFYEVRKYDMKCGLKTNGVLLHKYADAIAETCTWVKISVDAGTPETYEKVHSPMWQKLWKNISELIDTYQGTLAVDFLAHPINYLEIIEFLNVASEHRVSHAGIKPALLFGLELSDFVIKTVNNEVKRFRLETDRTLPIYSRMYRARQQRIFDRCRVTPLTVTVGADLHVYACCRKRGNKKLSFGNLKNQSLKEIWFGKHREKVVNVRLDVSECLPWWCFTANPIVANIKDFKDPEFL